MELPPQGGGDQPVLIPAQSVQQRQPRQAQPALSQEKGPGQQDGGGVGQHKLPPQRPPPPEADQLEYPVEGQRPHGPGEKEGRHAGQGHPPGPGLLPVLSQQGGGGEPAARRVGVLKGELQPPGGHRPRQRHHAAEGQNGYPCEEPAGQRHPVQQTALLPLGQGEIQVQKGPAAGREAGLSQGGGAVPPDQGGQQIQQRQGPQGPLPPLPRPPPSQGPRPRQRGPGDEEGGGVKTALDQDGEQNGRGQTVYHVAGLLSQIELCPPLPVIGILIPLACLGSSAVIRAVDPVGQGFYPCLSPKGDKLGLGRQGQRTGKARAEPLPYINHWDKRGTNAYGWYDAPAG